MREDLIFIIKLKKAIFMNNDTFLILINIRNLNNDLININKIF